MAGAIALLVISPNKAGQGHGHNRRYPENFTKSLGHGQARSQQKQAIDNRSLGQLRESPPKPMSVSAHGQTIALPAKPMVSPTIVEPSPRRADPMPRQAVNNLGYYSSRALDCLGRIQTRPWPAQVMARPVQGQRMLWPIQEMANQSHWQFSSA